MEKITSDSFFFKVGFSHTLKICVPKGIKIYSFKNNSVIIVGIDKQKLKEFAIRIKKKKRPNVYKNKGIFLRMKFLFERRKKQMKKHYKNKKENRFILFLIKERILIGEHLSLTDISQYYFIVGHRKKKYTVLDSFFLKNHLKFF